jgi:hypothetical protein
MKTPPPSPFSHEPCGFAWLPLQAKHSISRLGQAVQSATHVPVERHESSQPVHCVQSAMQVVPHCIGVAPEQPPASGIGAEASLEASGSTIEEPSSAS